MDDRSMKAAGIEWIKEARNDPKNNLNKSILETEIACNTRILEILKMIIAQRASASAIKRLIDLKQVSVDPRLRNPDSEEKIAKRNLKG